MVIQVQSVTKQFGAFKAVDDISFFVERGEVVGFVGANGAGKSTTINQLLGFIRPTRGRVRIFDEVVQPQTAHRLHAKIGFAAGDMELPAGLTGAQYLKFVAHQSRQDVRKKQAELCALFQPQLQKKIGKLSRGNKQKIALIAAFLASPELVILDEPTSGLDPIMQEKFLGLVRAEQRLGTTIFMSSHYLNEVADVCTRVILMRNGVIINDIEASELLSRSGKQVRVVSGYQRITVPKGASDSEMTTDENGNTTLSFSWNDEPAKLQQWLVGVKQLKDIEVTEFNLEAAFKNMYDDEEAR